MRALLGAPISRDRGAVPRQAHNLKVARATGYMINVASNRNGVGYGKWLHVDGWSDAVVRFMSEHERADEVAD